MPKLYISPEVQRDLQSIKEYIAKELENPVASLKVISRLTNAMRKLEHSPNIGALLSSIVDVQTDYRFLVSGSYLVFYRHEGGAVYIVRVLYGRRDYLKILFGEPPKEK